MTDGTARARDYYRALDEHDYDALSALLADDFVHDRPDATLEGRERFVEFMREERPQKSTRHPVDGVYTAADGSVAVDGRLLGADGDCIVEFVDVFSFEDGRITRIRTFTSKS